MNVKPYSCYEHGPHKPLVCPACAERQEAEKRYNPMGCPLVRQPSNG